MSKVADSQTVFTVEALTLADNADTDTECETPDAALTHLRELVLNELADPDGAYDRYGLYLNTNSQDREGHESHE